MKFIFEMANNHQGNVDTAFEIVDMVDRIIRKRNIKGFIKLQFRDLPNFIHENYINSDIKHVKRFMETKIDDSDFKVIINYIREKGIGLIATPFDEKSVEKCIKYNVDYIKIASCSMTDWPLMEKIAEYNKPVIVSTGGWLLPDIDNIVNFFEHRNIKLILMHCVAEYPTQDNFNLSLIKRYKKRYKGIEIGYSGHEEPENIFPGIFAYSQGATVFERHVGVKELNAYSMNEYQADQWVGCLLQTNKYIGDTTKHIKSSEISSINSLMRGVYAKNEIKQGDVIKTENVFFAMPMNSGQLNSSEFGSSKNEIIANKDYKKNEQILLSSISEKPEKVFLIRKYIHMVKGIINESGINISNMYSAELSHHYGIEEFNEYGATIINLINMEYCKKLIIQLKDQQHPTHFHRQKAESFHILYGELELEIDGKKHILKEGDIFDIGRHRRHSFKAITNCIFEEISTTYIPGDSHYDDINIMRLDPIERKTKVNKL